MLIISPSDCIRCYFDNVSRSVRKSEIAELDVFYAETKDLNSRYFDLKNYITDDEQLRADKFHFDEDMETYVSCHATLRLVLAKELNTDPSEISFVKGRNNKPGLTDNPFYFNITHTRHAFAFIISRRFYVGIDLEKINLNMDFYSIIRNFFSDMEREFILQSHSGVEDRFFLLWTRKEALLKALGTGIIDNLTQIEVSGEENYLNRRLFDDLISDSAFTELFIYSQKLQNYYLSIAIPRKATININHLNNENIVSYLD